MFPRLIEIPLFNGIPINSYGFMIMVGFLLATWIGVRRGRQIGIDTDFLLDVGIIAMILGILGAKLNYILQYPQDYADPGKGSVFNIGDGGLHPLGALLGIVPYLFWFMRARKEAKVPLMNWKNGVLLVSTLLLALIGTRILYVIIHSDEYNVRVIKQWQSGFVLYGGLVAAILGGVLYTKMRGVSLGKVADVSAPSIMLGLAFGRIGCFLNGCCFGDRSDLPWAVSFPKNPVSGELSRNSPAWDYHSANYNLKPDAEWSFPVHPTQLYETIVAVGLFFFLSWLWKRWKDRGKGEVFLVMGMLYAVWRFFVEILRDDPGRELGVFGMTYSQGVSVLVFAVLGVWFLLLRFRKPKPEPVSETPSEPPPSPAEPES